MPAHNSFNYAVIRIVPRVERQEFINAGVILYCRTLDYLDVLIDFELKRLRAFAPDSDFRMIRAQLESLALITTGKGEDGYYHSLSKSERFSWITSPSSTIIQVSPVHSGICEDPGGTLHRLYEFFVP